MISLGKRCISLRAAGVALFAVASFAVLCAVISPARALTRQEPPWHIESFCHRGATAAHRCLVRARQGIIVFQLTELASAPTIKWRDGIAVLTTGKDDRSRQLRFFVPPQKLSVPFKQVRAYNTRQQLIAFYADGRLHLRAMFADARDLAVMALPADIVADTLRVRFEGRSLHASWRDSKGQAQQRAVTAKG